MTQRPDDTRLHDWLDDSVGQIPDPVEGTQQVMSQVEETPQAGRWLPFPVFHRKSKARTPTTNDTTEYQSSPIRAMNGHTPTVIGRTHSMLNPPAKAIVAGTLVFAIGGVLLIAQPFDQQAVAPGAEADFAPPVEVTGTSASPAGCTETDYEGSFEDIGVDARLFSCSTEAGMPWSFTDPRLEGVVIRKNEESHIDLGDGPDAYIAQSAISIENDGGAWRERPRPWLLRDFDFLPDEVVVLDGTGDYEGLVTVLRATDPNGALSEFHGFILDARWMPPAPENASTQ